jgi:glycosyltransferase involved in cell wall biosynthesis
VPETVVVVVPAHNEEAAIGACARHILASFEEARCDGLIVVAADRCDDATEEHARATLGAHGIVLRGAWGSAGGARAAGVAGALDRVAGDRTWIANTDADTTVPRDWIAHQLRHARQGAAAVAGIVDVASFNEHPPPTGSRFRRFYAIPHDAPHGHVHGANFGIDAAAYLACGGWRDVSVGEDHLLWNEVRAQGYRTVSCSRLVVTTSGRRYGRAVGGFADTLRALGEAS